MESLESRTLLNAGDLNLAFGGGDGRLLFAPPAGGGVAMAVATQPDGRFVLVGTATQSGKKVAWLERLDPKGNLDAAFGTGGVVKQSINRFSSAVDVVRQGDGKIIIVGATTTGGFVARFTSTGKLDTGFGGGDGVANTNTLLLKAVILANGNIAALANNHRVFEFNSNGSLNSAFGSGGSIDVVAGLPQVKSFTAVDLDAQKGNKLVVTGSAQFVTPDGVLFQGSAVVVQLTSSGKPDKTFDSDGFKSLAFSGEDYVAGAAVQSTGTIVVAAGDDNANSFIVGLKPNGPDAFSVKSDWSSSFAEGPTGIAIDTSDRILLIGHTDLDLAYPQGFRQSQEFALQRFSPAGVHEFSKTIDFGRPDSFRDDYCYAVAAAGDGNIIIVGRSEFADSGGDEKIAIASIQGKPGGPSDKLLITRDPTQITITGTDQADKIRIWANGELFVEANGNVGHYTTWGARILVKAGDGNDRIEVVQSNGESPITLNGGAGNDTLIGGLGTETFQGGGGTDTADYSRRAENLNISLDNNANDGVAGEHDNVMADVENITGGSGNDRLTGNPFANLLKGGAGNDTLYSGAGNDTLDGGSGRDLMFGQDGNDRLLAKDGRTDSLDGGNGVDSAQRDKTNMIDDKVLSIEAFIAR